MTSFLRSDRSRAVAVWLLVCAVLVFAMVVVGGATRLTDSGLSITEWKPVSGALPPIGQAAWADEFARYQQIPQYRALNPDMTIEAFKSIYWWEWSHRLLGRLVGVVFAVPLVVFAIRRQIPRRLILRCVAMLGLGGLQGLVGWWMVASGLTKRVSVAPERLMTHLGLALLLFVLLIWTALDAWAGQPRQTERGGWPRIGVIFLAGVFLQSLLGALVAGNDAGLIYNDWPLFAGKLLPRDYFGDGFWATIAHSQAAVQLHHRLGAYILFVAAIILATVAARSRALALETRALAVALAVGVLLQACLGVATLMAVAPLWLSILHQIGAALLLALATAFAWRARRV